MPRHSVVERSRIAFSMKVHWDVNISSKEDFRPGIAPESRACEITPFCLLVSDTSQNYILPLHPYTYSCPADDLQPTCFAHSRSDSNSHSSNGIYPGQI